MHIRTSMRRGFDFTKLINNLTTPKTNYLFFRISLKSYFFSNKIKKNQINFLNKIKPFSFWIKYKNHLSTSIKIIIILNLWNKARVSYYVNNWIYTTNHKRIAINYFWFVILSGIVGMVLATIIRLEFAYPGVGVLAGDSIQYLSLASAHGVIMVFFMIMPLLFGAFANFLLPTQLGVHDVAFPRLNSAAFWFLPGGLLMLCQLVCVDRRYQRMNCFNIREMQSLLKRKFFTDLINTKDHHTLLNKTSMGLRFKTNTSGMSQSNLLLSYIYGPELNSVVKISNFINPSLVSTESTAHHFFSFFFFNVVNSKLLFNFFFYINNLFINLIYNNLQYTNCNLFFTNVYNLFFFYLIEIDLFFKQPFVTLHNVLVNVLENLFFNNFFFLQNFIIYKELRSLFNLTFSSLNEFFISMNGYEISRFFSFKVTNFSNFSQNPLSASPVSILNWLKELFVIKEIEFNLLTIFFNLISAIWLKIFNFFFLISNFFSWNTTALSVSNFEIKNNPKTTNLFFSDKNLKYELVCSTDNSFTQGVYTTCSLYLPVFFTIFESFYALVFGLIQISLVLIDTASTAFFSFGNEKNYSNFFISNLTQLFYFLSNEYLQTMTPYLAIFTINDKNLTNLSICTKQTFFFLNASTAYNTILVDFFKSFFVLNISNCLAIINFTMLSVYELLIFFFVTISNLHFFFFDLKTFEIFSKIYNFTQLNLGSLFNLTSGDKNSLYFSSNYLIEFNSIDKLLNQNEETNLTARNLKFANPVFKYDYKSGDYFPKLYKEVYGHLYSSILDLTSGLKTSPWFFSNNTAELISSNFANFNVFSPQNTLLSQNTSNLSMKTFNKVLHTDAFYNFFFFIKNEQSLTLNYKFIAVDSLNLKFQKMFLTSSLQQRIYANWRQLKFTREAWRCKLLAARHQKTLFKRYVHEDGVFWSIERNAKDLIPGWAMITPFSARTRFTAVGKTDIGLMGVLLVLNSSIVSGANFLVTYRYLSTLNNRKMRDARAFFTEAVMVASWMMILANPMLIIGIIMLLSDRHWQTSFFDYSGGGDTVLFQHMFWFFGHPEVYIIILPTFGFTNTMISYYLKKRVSARASLLYSMYTIAFLGFFVWGHHMYMVGLAHTTRMLFSTLTVMISVPAATKIMHWCVTTVNSAFVMELPLLFTFTFIFFFVSGGISGMCVAHTGMDVLFHDTFYVIGHFHVMLAGGAMFASFGAFYFYFSAIFGVKYSRVYAYLHYSYYLIGQLMTIIPMFWLGYAGMPRRVLDYPSSFGGWHSVISAGHMLNVAGLMAFFIMIFDSLRQARASTRNNFGINRFNTRLNFYIYETSRSLFLQQKTLFLYKQVGFNSLKLNKFNYVNFEPYESVLVSYSFIK